jgi:DNA processing protein
MTSGDGRAGDGDLFDRRRVASGGGGAGDGDPLDRRRIALAGLLRSCEPPAPALARFVTAVGAEAAWDAVAGGCPPPEVAAATAPRVRGRSRAELDGRAADDLRRAAAAGAELLGPGDADWPAACLAGLDRVVPFDGCPTAAEPVALYRRGGRWPVQQRGAVAVVGSRSATPYGVRVATEMGAALAAGGFTVVSGAAFGVDAAAHRGALHAGTASFAADCPGGVTVAVLACGIDRCYPVAHRSLLDATAACGSVVSEYPPGTVPARYRFLVRNRLIAAFGEALVVVEAGVRSGSLNTATTALSLHRTVLAVPGPVTSALSAGCHDLIRGERAKLVTDARDVVGLVGPLQPAPPVHRDGDRPTDGLDLVTARVHDALPARGSATVEEISVAAGLPVGDVLGALAALQLDELAERSDGRWRRRR